MVPGARRESRWLTTSRTLSGVPSSVSGAVRRIAPSTTSTICVSIRPRHSSQTRNGLPPVSSEIAWASSGGPAWASVSPAWRTNSSTSSSDRPVSRSRTTSSERRRSASVSESVAGRSASVSRKVASTRTRALPAARARWRRSRSVDASAQWPSSSTSSTGRPAHPGEQVGDRRMQSVALGVGVGLDRQRQLAHPLGQIGEQPRELAARGAQRGPQLGGVDLARQVIERLDERPVGRGHHRVAAAVEDERTAAGRLARELAHQAALARAGLAAQQHDPAALALRHRHERPKGLDLGRAADERKRRREAQRPGKLMHVAAGCSP